MREVITEQELNANKGGEGGKDNPDGRSSVILHFQISVEQISDMKISSTFPFV
jgi:hypothetical protein